LGLLHEADSLFQRLAIDKVSINGMLEAQLGQAARPLTTADMPLSDPAKKILAAAEESWPLKHSHIGAVHLLFGGRSN
jgi:hypothetical protein